AGEGPGRGTARLTAAVTTLECLHEPRERVRRRARRPVGKRQPGSREPRELRSGLVELRRERGDLPERDATLALAVQGGPTRGRLRRVLAVENERLPDVVSLGDVEQARPEVEVLALLERGVVAQPVLLEHRPIEDDRRVEEGRGEERRPPHRAGSCG